MMLLLAILPIALLILLVTLQRPRRFLPLPAFIALPLVALLIYLLQWWSAKSSVGAPGLPTAVPPVHVHATAIDGVLSALTPLAILFGAVLLFRTLERSGAERVLTSRLRALSPDPVGQLVLVGWAFSFLIEGLSGFGTPAALTAPILVGLGFPPVRVAAMCLIMNSVPVAFGAVGTPIWFGFGELALTSSELQRIAFRASLVNAMAALPILLLALRLVIPWRDLRPRLGFIMLVAGATVIPYIIAAAITVEFPSIIGGLTGLITAAAATRLHIGLPRNNKATTPYQTPQQAPFGLARAALPLAAVILILAITRIEQLGVRPFLTAATPQVALPLGPLGELWVSPALVIGLRGILQTNVAWQMPLLYIPFILPFVVVSLAAIPLLHMHRSAVRAAWRETSGRLIRPAAALAGALVLAKMLMLGEPSPAMIMGSAMADAAGPAWPFFAPLLGALGSFFSGSCTVSNLTFGPVQSEIARTLDLDLATVLALQTVGGAMGNMVCIHNIVAVAAVLGIADRSKAHSQTPAVQGGIAAILRLTITPMLAYAAIAAIGAGVLLLLFP